MGVPEVRDDMRVTVETWLRERIWLDPNEVAEVVRRWENRLWRKPPVRPPVRVQSRKVTPALAEQVRLYARQHPDLSMDRVGDHFAINQGRVSECLTGQR